MIRLTPVVKNIIILNVAIFLVSFIFVPLINELGAGDVAYSLKILIAKMMIWKSDAILSHPAKFVNFLPIQVVTGFLLHTEVFHILFNMLALYFIGVSIENTIGSRRFAKFYIFCGVLSGILIAFLDPSDFPVLGASTAISGILAAFGIMHPDAQLSLIFLPPIKAKSLFLGAAVISAFLVMLQMADPELGGGISHFGHLAGMLAGALFFYLEKYIPFLRN